MPASTWDEVAGQICTQCGRLATHQYGNIYLCCQCHAGPEYSQGFEIISTAHIVELRKRIEALEASLKAAGIPLYARQDTGE